MENNWYLMPYSKYPGATNMAVDLLLSQSYLQLLNRPLLRFYGWAPYTISLGHSQLETDVDLKIIEADGLGVVRRPTGGRAIYHAHELTYSIIYPKGEFKKESLYHQVNLWFKKLLENLGVTSTLENEQPDFKKHYQDMKSAPCFSASAKYELKVDGRKIVGSAQRIFADAILQHGSFILDKDHLKLVDYLTVSNSERSHILSNLENHSTHLNMHIQNKFSAHAISELFLDILKEQGLKFEVYAQSDEVLNTSQTLYKAVTLSEKEIA